jgi:1,3-beta-glucanosyltransferase GAS1
LLLLILGSQRQRNTLPFTFFHPIFTARMRKVFRAVQWLLAISALVHVSTVDAISKISRSGRYLYSDDGNRFYIKGIAYQEQGTVVASADNAFGEPSSFVDPLADGAACERDLLFLKQLTVNTIRVYSVNSSLNHDACMSALSGAGIYTIIDLALPLNGSITRVAPSWSTNILDQYIATINAFSKYDNVLAYNVGNEVVVENGTDATPYIKAAARDIKAYLASKSSSALVGYAAIDGSPDWRDPVANYLSCDPTGGNSGASAIDLYGLNNYEWCGSSSFEASYAGTNGDYAGYNVAAYFSEFGCLKNPPRLWTEAGALFSGNMSPVWSGGLAFSYFPAQSAAGQFGMVTISSDGKTVTTSPDFDALKTQYGQLSPPNSPSKSSAATTYPACPTTNTTFVASTSLPPTPNEAACNCLESTLSCRFTPATANYTAVVGSLLDTACSLLGQKGGSCVDISGSGSTGTYGRVAGCDPTIKLSYIMSQFYEVNNRDPQACSFAGNGTVNPLAPSSVSAANSAASSCVSNPAATFTPTAPAGGSGGSSTGTASASGKPNAAVDLFVDGGAFVGMGVMAAIGIVSAIWTLT